MKLFDSSERRSVLTLVPLLLVVLLLAVIVDVLKEPELIESEPVAVEPKKLNIVEGTYSRHPVFGDCYDLRIFLTVSEELQAQRVRQRPAFLHRRFFEEWIPMERLYFSTFSIRETSHLVLDPTGDKMM